MLYFPVVLTFNLLKTMEQRLKAMERYAFSGGFAPAQFRLLGVKQVSSSVHREGPKIRVEAGADKGLPPHQSIIDL